jgi:hypothetical protein
VKGDGLGLQSSLSLLLPSSSVTPKVSLGCLLGPLPTPRLCCLSVQPNKTALPGGTFVIRKKERQKQINVPLQPEL